MKRLQRENTAPAPDENTPSVWLSNRCFDRDVKISDVVEYLDQEYSRRREWERLNQKEPHEIDR